MTLDSDVGDTRAVDDRVVTRVRYFLRVHNVGDRLVPRLLTSVFDIEPFWSPDHSQEHLIAVGSLMAWANRRSHIWGAGIMDPSLPIGDIDPKKVSAVRGKLTYSCLRNAGVRLRDVPLGDPAVLFSRQRAAHARRQIRFRLGIAAHYVDRHHAWFRAAIHDQEVADLNVHADPDAFFDALLQCEAVASSSLHGLILAEACGIPNVWLQLSTDIVGGQFKFHDWFSMASEPQRHPLSSSSTLLTVRHAARLHEMAIDGQALHAAFPRAALNVMSARRTGIRTHRECRHQPIPIFVVSYNRGTFLSRVIKSYRELSTPVDIVIVDFGSDDRDTCEILHRLSETTCAVVRMDKIDEPDDLNCVDDVVADYFRHWAEPGRYVVTDCDIDLSKTASDALAVYDELLDAVPQAECVGPMLRITDIPSTHPLFNRIMNRQIEQFWSKTPQFIHLSPHRIVASIGASIDTTFALHRAGERFRRLKNGLRTYWPYEAGHLDWYFASEDESRTAYSMSASPEISHWNSRPHLERWRHERLRFDRFIDVERTSTGGLTIRTRHV